LSNQQNDDKEFQKREKDIGLKRYYRLEEATEHFLEGEAEFQLQWEVVEEEEEELEADRRSQQQEETVNC
jgi:hypothetical protein